MAYDAMPFYKDLVRSSHANQFGVQPHEVRITNAVPNAFHRVPRLRGSVPHQIYISTHAFQAVHTDPQTGRERRAIWYGSPKESHSPYMAQPEQMGRN